MTAALLARARRSFGEHLASNPYPGRGLVIGRAPSGDWLQVYWLMGRSTGSRNRVFVADGETLATRPFEEGGAVGDASLTLYAAMRSPLAGAHVVTNGDQTDTVCEALEQGGRFAFEEALATREREPDAPNYTPRIAGLLDLRGAHPELALAILKASPADPEATDRFHFRPALPPPGLGLGLTTYRGDGDPLPPFEGEPLWLPLEGDPAVVLEAYWEALEAANRVALAVKRIPADGGPATIVCRDRHGTAPDPADRP